MTRRTKLWLYGSLLFALVNAAGAVFAAARGGDVMHVGSHILLLALGLYVARRVAPRSGREAMPSEATPSAPLFDERLDRLQQSLDAIAVEVERVEEGQRIVVKLRQQVAENSDSQ